MLLERSVRVDDLNYYFDINSRQKSRWFSPGFYFNMSFPDGSIINIPPECINSYLEGNWFKIDGVRWNIKDDTNKEIVKNGYFVHGKHDRVRESDSSKGVQSRINVMNDIENGFTMFLINHPELDNPQISERGNNFTVSFDKGRYHYSFNLCTINNIVNKNYRRKQDGLKYLPFDSNIDKYNAYYMYVQVNEIEEQLSIFGMDSNRQPKVVSEEIIEEVLSKLKGYEQANFTDYKFIDMTAA